MPFHLFGIRHHGPGSARSLREALLRLQPDLVLVEGPPEGDALLPLAVHPEMAPPVSLLVYAPDDPSRAVYYPFASFSPEWQAICHALEREIPVRFMDLPMCHHFALCGAEDPAADDASGETDHSPLRSDPLGRLAEAAGYGDGELWWEHMVEERLPGEDLFQGISEAMTALRESSPLSESREDRMEALREAHMRSCMRQARKEGFQRVAVVCGAWHVPALSTLPPRKDDDALLKGLPKIKTTATWVPWTYGRLTYGSGYGAGIKSPGWYHHLWETEELVAVRWLTAVAHHFRQTGMEISPAHVIEAVRLAEALATMRGRPQPGLTELNDAVRSVMLFGETLPMALLHQRLIVGERLGEVPSQTPMTPLRQDLTRECKRLRLKPSASDEEMILDLRTPVDRERSALFRRLNLLQVAWAKGGERAGGKGTFKERWRVMWQPEHEVRLIEAGRFGTTLACAATAAVVQAAASTRLLPELSSLAQQVIFAGLDQAVEKVMERLQGEAAGSGDICNLMEALPTLAGLLRYGDVRNSSHEIVEQVVDGLVTRVCIGLPNACSGLGEEAAGAMFDRIRDVNAAVGLLDDQQYRGEWLQALTAMSGQKDLHPVLQGRCCRLLLEAGAMDDEEAARRFGLELSPSVDPLLAAGWLDGFLRGSGEILIHDKQLWGLVDRWISSLPEQGFPQLLPLLRRTFSSFTVPQRRRMGERAREGGAAGDAQLHRQDDGGFDHERGAQILPVVMRLLGLQVEPDGEGLWKM